jgi:predicted DNA-binding ribbon-helix-helix protein
MPEKKYTMRTTLDISDDVLFAAKEIARHDHKTLGQVISELARQAFAQQSGTISSSFNAREPLAIYGIEPLAKRGGVVSNALIDRLRDKEGI